MGKRRLDLRDTSGDEAGRAPWALTLDLHDERHERVARVKLVAGRCDYEAHGRAPAEDVAADAADLLAVANALDALGTQLRHDLGSRLDRVELALSELAEAAKVDADGRT